MKEFGAVTITNPCTIKNNCRYDITFKSYIFPKHVTVSSILYHIYDSCVHRFLSTQLWWDLDYTRI